MHCTKRVRYKLLPIKQNLTCSLCYARGDCPGCLSCSFLRPYLGKLGALLPSRVALLSGRHLSGCLLCLAGRPLAFVSCPACSERQYHESDVNCNKKTTSMTFYHTGNCCCMPYCTQEKATVQMWHSTASNALITRFTSCSVDHKHSPSRSNAIRYEVQTQLTGV